MSHSPACRQTCAQQRCKASKQHYHMCRQQGVPLCWQQCPASAPGRQLAAQSRRHAWTSSWQCLPRGGLCCSPTQSLGYPCCLKGSSLSGFRSAAGLLIYTALGSPTSVKVFDCDVGIACMTVDVQQHVLCQVLIMHSNESLLPGFDKDLAQLPLKQSNNCQAESLAGGPQAALGVGVWQGSHVTHSPEAAAHSPKICPCGFCLSICP